MHPSIAMIYFNRSHTEIEFPLLDLEITLPPSVKCKDSAIRVLWLSYDHFSDYSPSYEIPFKVDTTIGNISQFLAVIKYRKTRSVYRHWYGYS